MNFINIQYWPGIAIGLIVFILTVLLMESRFFKFIKTYWFYRRSLFSYFSSFLLLLGMSGLLLSLLDIRGEEERVKMQVPKDRTIILIDTSASMLAEDVNPSRLQKAALIAKHFARKAAGHQLSIVAFAEITKKIVPFTTDIDLIDARLDSLKNLRNQYGSSALSVAIQESVQYFRETGDESSGNILVLTDGEETSEGIDFKIPKGIHVALVAVGTTQGGRIPLDDGRGFRFGYKKDQGRDVTTKLNESFFKKAVASIPSGKYWLTNSYSLPSEEIIEFFQTEKLKGNEEQDMVIRPVLMEWIVIPSLLILFLSYIFKSIRIFTLSLFLIISTGHAQDQEEKKELPLDVVKKLEQLQNGKLGRIDKIKLADDLYKGGSKEEALSLYRENLPEKIDSTIPQEAYLNYGTALLESGDSKGGFSIYEELRKTSEDKKIKDAMDKNVLSYFVQQEQKKKEQEQKKNNENKENKEDKDKKEDQSGDGQQKDQNSKKSDQQNKKDQKNNKGDQDKNQKDQKDQEKKDSGDKEKDDKDKKSDNSEKENDKKDDGQENKKPLPPAKLPAKIKQLMSDDRQLQMRMIENGTRELNKKKSRKSKDW